MISGDLKSYRLTPRAEADLEEIWLYSAQTWSPDQADAYIDRIVKIIATIVVMPTIARQREEFAPPVRIHPAAEHLIIYRVEEAVLLVIRILGGRQNWRAMLEALDT